MSNSTAKWLAVIIFLQVITIIGQWVITPSATPAQAQIPDSGAQRAEIINQLRSSNDKLERLLTLLSGGNLQVRVQRADDAKGH